MSNVLEAISKLKLTRGYYLVKIVFFVTSLEVKRRVFVLSWKELVEMRALVLEVYLLQRSLFYRLFQM